MSLIKGLAFRQRDKKKKEEGERRRRRARDKVCGYSGRAQRQDANRNSACDAETKVLHKETRLSIIITDTHTHTLLSNWITVHVFVEMFY